MAAPARPATARDVMDMLRRHYLPESRPAGGIFAPEIAAPDGSRRADLIWQGCSAAGGHELVGHEVKVTRADVAVELADPTKSDPWQRYCDRWWLVIPDSVLIDGLTLPPSWGVLTPPSGRRTRSMTIHTPAPALKPANQAPALRTLASWLHYRHDETARALAEARERARSALERAQEAEARAPHDSRYETRLHEVVDEIVRRLGGPSTDLERLGQAYGNGVEVDDLVAALSGGVAAVRGRLQMARSDLRRRHELLQSAVRSLDRDALTKVDEAMADLDALR